VKGRGGGDWVKSHFGKFVGIPGGTSRPWAKGDDPDSDPARPVEPA